MIDKNQIQIFRFRDKILDISELEEKYKQKLPPIYRSFITVFYNGMGQNSLYSKEEDLVTSFISFIYPDRGKEEYTYEDDVLAFMYFKSPEELLKYGYEIDGWEDDTAYIAKHAYGGGLKVGLASYNLDVIYLEDEKVANNIFEFLHKVVPIINRESFPNLETKKVLKKLNSRNWEEI